MGIFDKLFKRNKKGQLELPIDETPEPEKKIHMEYSLVRALPDPVFSEDKDLKPNVRLRAQLESSIKAMLPLIDTKPVVIYYSNSKNIGVEKTAELIEKLLEEHKVSVSSKHQSIKLNSGEMRSMYEATLQKIAIDIYNGEYIIYVTHESNISFYMKHNHQDKPYTQAQHGQAVSSNGELL